MTAPARPVTELPRSIPVGLARRTMRTVQRVRSNLFFGALLVLFLGILGRLVQVQIVNGAEWRGFVADQQRPDRVRALRGPIVDRNGRALAISRPVRHVIVDAGGRFNPKTKAFELAIEDLPRFALTLSDVLEGEPAPIEIRQELQARRARGDFAPSGTALVTIKRDIDDPRIISRLDATRLPGLLIEVADRRDYPNGSWGGFMVGVASAENAWSPVKGRDGLEQGLDAFLTGQAVTRRWAVDGRGRRYATKLSTDQGPDAEGRTAWLTLDLVIQGYAEQALDRLMEEWRPRGAVAIVLDPATGDVLALATRPTYDAARSSMSLATQWTTEVGSTFKPFTFARALELGLVGLEEPFELPRERAFRIGRSEETIHDAHDGGESHPGGTFRDVLAQSNNPDSAEAGRRIGNDGMLRLLEDLEVTRPFPIPGFSAREACGYLPRKDRRGAFDHLRFAFGHSFTMTPLRLASLYTAFARDDFAPIAPRMILAIGGEALPEGQVGPTLLRDPAKRRALRDALKLAVTEGTGRGAVLSPKYDIAGKTGTAKKPPALGADRYYSCSFVGYAPADAPRLVCLVMAQEPGLKGDERRSKPYGGAVAGPAVRSILERTLEEYMGVPTKDGSVAPTVPLAPVPTLDEGAR